MSERPPVDPDDLAPWVDDDLVRALRAPGTATELADQEHYVAAYRGAGRSSVRSLPRRAAGRLGAGGTAVVVTVALTSGVAAAYTGHLPDPVQQIAHAVMPFGAPAPDLDGRHHSGTSGRKGGAVATGSASPDQPASTDPTSSASGDPTSPVSTSSSTGPDSPGSSAPAGRPGTPGTNPSSPAADPSPGTTTSPATSSGGAASSMSMSGPAHRVGLGQAATLTGLVTDSTGAPLPDHTVVLQVRGPEHWRPLVETTTDATGLASATTPAITHSARFRWKADRGVTSAPWLLRMVPIVTLSADVGGTTTTVTTTAQGSAPGDRLQLFRHIAGRTRLVRRARLDSTGSLQIAVATPRRRATYVVRLLGTKRHAPVRARVVVVPPPPATLSIAGSSDRVVVGGSTVIGGTVTSASGALLPGHRVVLLRRGAARWRQVGHAVTDADGHVSIATPPVTDTSRFRLATDHHVHSAAWRVVEVPTLTASAERSSDTVAINVSASGARAGDRVVLLRRVEGRLVRMRHGPLGAGGSATFSVKARAARTTYVVRLAATQRHGQATASLTVPGTA
jgi:hypothetical protein